MKVNYHTHTTRCMHARGIDEEYVKSAIKGGFDILGFSDHTPWKYDSDFVAHMRMPISQLSEYLDSIRSLREKYKDQIKILVGLECEYYECYHENLKKLIEDNQLDYVIFGNHYNKTDEIRDYFGFTKDEAKLNEYVDSSIKGMESGVYAYFAHPDLYMNIYGEFDELARSAAHKICSTAKRLDMILEYNLGGVRYGAKGRECGYPCDDFWKVAAEYKNKAIVGVDAHDNTDLEDKELFDEAVAYLESLGLEVVNEIPLRRYE